MLLKKLWLKKLPVILIINKIDRQDARIQEVINEVYDLFIDLDANDEQIEFKILYTNAKKGIAHHELGDSSETLKPLFDTIIKEIPGPESNDDEVPQFLVTNLDYDHYVGQIAVGRLSNGTLEMAKNYTLCGAEKNIPNVKLTALYTFVGLSKKLVPQVFAGDIIALAGIDDIKIGDTISSLVDPKPLPRIKIDEPTVSMIFYVNDSPFAGKEGKFLTSRHLSARLEREAKGNVSLQVRQMERKDTFEVLGRGELQMAVLIETMRREGFELMVSKPQVITKKIDGVVNEPVERLYIDIPEEFIGVITEKISNRKGQLVNLTNSGSGRADLEFLIPARGLIGFRSQFLTDTKGSGVMNTLFEGYAPWFGDIPHRQKGAIISDRTGKVNNFALIAMADRGELFVSATTPVYQGMIVGERNKALDLEVNITKEKKLSNMRSSTSEITVTIRPPRPMSLDQTIEFIAEDELVEITPLSIRLRKMELDPNKRKVRTRS